MTKCIIIYATWPQKDILNYSIFRGGSLHGKQLNVLLPPPDISSVHIIYTCTIYTPTTMGSTFSSSRLLMTSSIINYFRWEGGRLGQAQAYQLLGNRQQQPASMYPGLILGHACSLRMRLVTESVESEHEGCNPIAIPSIYQEAESTYLYTLHTVVLNFRGATFSRCLIFKDALYKHFTGKFSWFKARIPDSHTQGLENVPQNFQYGALLLLLSNADTYFNE